MLKITASFTLSEPIVKKLEEYSKNSGLAKSDIVRRALEKFIKENEDQANGKN